MEQPTSIRAGQFFASWLMAAAGALGAAPRYRSGTPSRESRGRGGHYKRDDLPRGYPGAKIARACALKRATLR